MQWHGTGTILIYRSLEQLHQAHSHCVVDWVDPDNRDGSANPSATWYAAHHEQQQRHAEHLAELRTRLRELETTVTNLEAAVRAQQSTINICLNLISTVNRRQQAALAQEFRDTLGVLEARQSDAEARLQAMSRQIQDLSAVRWMPFFSITSTGF